MKFRPVDEALEAEEEKLSQILFGGAKNFLHCLEEAEQEAGASQDSQESGSQSNTDSGVGEDSSDTDEVVRKPAWVDEEDDGIEVGEALNAQHRKLPKGGLNSRGNKYADLLKHKFQAALGTPRWADLNKRPRTDSGSDDEILQTCGFLTTTSSSTLPSNLLEYKKVRDLNHETLCEGPFINSVEFHPTSSVAMVTGNAGIMSLFAVDSKQNKKLHSAAFQGFPIVCAKFAKGGNEAILGSRHPHIYSYDLLAAKPVRMKLPQGITNCKKFIISPDSEYMAVAGKWGEVHLLSAMSKERICLLKQDNEVTALSFNSSGSLLFGHSDSGEVTIWDMRSRRVKHKFTDEGCLQGTTIAISKSSQFLAAGSAQGVVNLYGMEDVLHNKLPKPRKTILNLTTGITDLKFNPTSEMLAFSSAEIQNSAKLFHIGSGTVFSNFPNFNTKMGHITTFNFSPSSGYIAFGNRSSEVSLYRLKHYKNY
ncbi:unnamed protein product [Acanthoscelides obtectus]|uniref:U3 small nucleolar RNA-associated protein 18 homolog n=1 Tax=Acanthoscelides obtectus TaxID=200917 RepID=A0A9P0LRJ1_ACAOB|nr:unnamed protein product [Acanthoscelides obtectus]CAK1621442.1 U3 small nucleolar RNA-associated protein 18 homolog [Acanthoscelides obtectus]